MHEDQAEKHGQGGGWASQHCVNRYLQKKKEEEKGNKEGESSKHTKGKFQTKKTHLGGCQKVSLAKKRGGLKTAHSLRMGSEERGLNAPLKGGSNGRKEEESNFNRLRGARKRRKKVTRR